MDKIYSRIYLVLPEIKELLAERRKQELKEVFEEYEPIEVVDALKDFSLKDKVYLFSIWDIDFSADVFEKLDEEEQIEFLEVIDDVKRGKLLNELAPDERADLFEELSPEMVKRFLSIMAKEEAQEVRELLTYPSTSAGGKMTTEFASIREGMNVDEALKILRKTAKDIEMIYYIYVLDEDERLVGVLSLKELISAEPEDKISELMHTNPVALPVFMDQEEVAHWIANYDFLALPVVEKNKKMKGIITVDDVIDIIREENTEDMYKFGAAGEYSEGYVKVRPLTIVKNRLPWLFVLALAGFFSGIVMQRFEFALESMVALAFYIPVLMDTAGNAGTQSAMTVVRGLAIGEVKLSDIWGVVKKEILIGGLLGIPLGALGFFRAILLQRSSLLGICVAFSMLIAIMAATSLGALLPLFCRKLKLDPAVVSGPLITTVLDVFALFVYFSVSILFLSL